MTAITAREAGVPSVWIAIPKPAPITLAAAAVAGADGVLAAGGAHAIAALAFGVGPIPPSDVVVGPGNLYVTAAKQLLAGQIKIDMLAGPSELVVVADVEAGQGLTVCRDVFDYRPAYFEEERLHLYTLRFWEAFVFCMAFEDPDAKPF